MVSKVNHKDLTLLLLLLTLCSHVIYFISFFCHFTKDNKCQHRKILILCVDRMCRTKQQNKNKNMKLINFADWKLINILRNDFHIWCFVLLWTMRKILINLNIVCEFSRHFRENFLEKLDIFNRKKIIQSFFRFCFSEKC